MNPVHGLALLAQFTASEMPYAKDGSSFFGSTDCLTILAAYIFVAIPITFAMGRRHGLGVGLSSLCCLSIPLGALAIAIFPLWVTLTVIIGSGALVGMLTPPLVIGKPRSGPPSSTRRR